MLSKRHLFVRSTLSGEAGQSGGLREALVGRHMNFSLLHCHTIDEGCVVIGSEDIQQHGQSIALKLWWITDLFKRPA